MSSSKPVNKSIKPVTNSQKANPIGAHLLNYYYSVNSGGNGEKKMLYPVFTINSPKDIPIFCHLCKKEGLEKFGLVVVAGGRHRTPIFFNKDKVYILESLGTEKSRVGISSVTLIAQSIENSARLGGPSYEIFAFKKNRQIDSVSCGSESFLALKEAMKIGDRMEEFVQNTESVPLTLNVDKIVDKEYIGDHFFSRSVTISQVSEQPPQIFKYAQSASSFRDYPHRFESEEKSETPLQYAQRYSKRINFESSDGANTEKFLNLHGKDEKVELKKMRGTEQNMAVSFRREKHVRLLNQLSSLPEAELKEIVKEASGVNLLLTHVDTLPEQLLEECASHMSEMDNKSVVTSDSLIDEYLTEELYKQRDEVSGIAPVGSRSFADLALEVKHLRLTDGISQTLKGSSNKTPSR